MSKPLSTVELPWRDWRDRGRPRPLSSFTWWWRWRRNVIVRFLSTTFSSLAMVKRMKANWTMLAMIWVCKRVMAKSIWRRVWINSQRCSETINNANMPTLLVKRPDRRSTRCALRWRSCMGGSRPQRQCLGGFSVSVWHWTLNAQLLTQMCEHEEECDEQNHPARDHLRGHKESQPREANLGGEIWGDKHVSEHCDEDQELWWDVELCDGGDQLPRHLHLKPLRKNELKKTLPWWTNFHLDWVHGILQDHEGVVVREVSQLKFVLKRTLELCVVWDWASQHHLCRNSTVNTKWHC